MHDYLGTKVTLRLWHVISAIYRKNSWFKILDHYRGMVFSNLLHQVNVSTPLSIHNLIRLPCSIFFSFLYSKVWEIVGGFMLYSIGKFSLLCRYFLTWTIQVLAHYPCLARPIIICSHCGDHVSAHNVSPIFMTHYCHAQ